MGNLHVGGVSKPLFRRTLQSPSATASFQGLHRHKIILGHMHGRVQFYSAYSVAPRDPADLTCLVARRQLEFEVAYPAIHP